MKINKLLLRKIQVANEFFYKSTLPTLTNTEHLLRPFGKQIVDLSK